MKKIFYLLSIFFLMSSCFSYIQTNISPSQMVAGKKYKIELNNKFKKVTIRNVNDSTAIVSNGVNTEQIQLKDIRTIQTRKFSVVKTLVLVPVTLTTVAIVSFIVDPKINTLGE